MPCILKAKIVNVLGVSRALIDQHEKDDGKADTGKRILRFRAFWISDF